MPTLTLDRMWVNLFSTGDGISAFSTGRLPVFTRLGEVRHLAGGRQRGMSIVGEQGQFSFTLSEVTLSTVDTLREWAGQTVQVRTDRGLCFVGVYYHVPLTEVPDLNLYNVSLSMRVVTAPDGA